MLHRLFFLLFVATLFAGCKREVDYITVPTSIDPKDPNQLSRYIVLPNGSLVVTGTPPAPNGGTQAPRISLVNTGSVTASNGGVAVLTFQVPGGTAALGGYYVQVQGSSTYFNVPVSASGNPSIASIPIQLPANTTNGRFCVNLWAYDATGRVSGVIQQCVDVLQLGTGDLQVNLTWDTNGTDVDLYVKEPNGNEIYFGDRSSSTGGQLDRDDTNGFGPENIYWLNQLPDGEYKISVDYFSGGPATNYYVTVTAGRTVKSYTGVLTNSATTKTVVTVRKQGGSYSFSN